MKSVASNEQHRCPTAAVPGAGLSGLALRMLARNAEARVEHLAAWLRDTEAGDSIPAELPARLNAATDRMIYRQLQILNHVKN